MTCKAIREGDEMVCWTCKLRWSIDEDRPDGCQGPYEDHRQLVTIEQAALKMALKLISSSAAMTDHERQCCLLAVQYVANPEMPADMKIDRVKEAINTMPSLGIKI